MGIRKIFSIIILGVVFINMKKYFYKIKKRRLLISYILLISSIIFFVYIFSSSPYVYKIPFLKKYAYFWSFKKYAKKFPEGSIERLHFETMAQNVIKNKTNYELEINSINPNLLLKSK